MSKCEISIKLDRDDRTYAAGTQVSGEVIVAAHEEMTFRKLKIELAWETHGRGNKDEKLLKTQIEPGASWTPGETYTFPFAFDLPEFPLTYHGSLLNVDYYVRVQVDVAWAFDPKAKEDFLVTPGTGSRNVYMTKEDLKDALEEGEQQKSGCVGNTIGWILLVLFIVPLLMLVCVLAPFMLIYYVFKYIRRRLVEKRLGKVNVLINTPTVQEENKWTDRVRPGKNDPKNQTYVITPGESFGVGIEFTPATDVHVNAITFEIHGEEECTSGSGSNATTHRHELFKEKVYLAEDTPYSAGQLNQFVAQIPVPDLPAYAFAASDNEVNWKLKTQVDIPKWPDWVEEYELRMVPAQVTE